MPHGFRSGKHSLLRQYRFSRMAYRGAWLPFGDHDSSIGVVRVRCVGRNDFAAPERGFWLTEIPLCKMPFQVTGSA